MQFEDEFEFIRYACKVCFSNIGHRSGYICIPNDHPLRSKSEADVDYALVCHGGTTFLMPFGLLDNLSISSAMTESWIVETPQNLKEV